MRNKMRALNVAVSIALGLLLAPPSSAQGIFFGWKIAEFQPDIANGGRANTITVNPTNNDLIIVASETGGLFRSTNRGVTWKHVDGLPEFGTVAVAYVPADPNVVIATVGEDTRVTNGGGIWRSTDGGVSWTQLPGPTAPAGVTDRLSAFEISIAPDNGTIYVGTQYGVSISHDNGATWTHVDPFGSGNRRILSVAAQTSNHVLAGGDAGIRRSGNGGATWLPPTAGSGPGAIQDIHALGGSPVANDQAYVVNWAKQLFFTEDAGDHWTRIMSAPGGSWGCGGISFVKAIGRTRFRAFPPLLLRFVDLYVGNRCGLSILTAPQIAGTNNYDYTGAWTATVLDHSDTRDLAFTNAKVRIPLLLGTDGGLHKTANGGINWTFTGGGHNGYNALQITEVKGQWITALARYDLYFGTQDNNLLASGNLGSTWINPVCCEGFFIESQHRVATAADSKTTFVTCGACVNLLADPLFTNVVLWPNPTSATGAPKIVRKLFHVQTVDSGPAFLARGSAVTRNLGATWGQYASFLEDPRDIPKLSDPGFFPVLYQPIRTGWDVTRGFEINHLARVVKTFFGGGGFVTYPLMNNFGGLGINPTMFAWYQVFGVDPGNTQHLIAPDVVNEKMMETKDGGDNWTEIPNLTSQITNAGQFQFRRWIFPQASAVSFSPDDPNIVAVGTWQGGLFISSDRGAMWWRVPGSEAITYITSVDWRTGNNAVISTYGRGLWTVYWGLIRPLPDFEKLCKLPCIILPIPPIGDPIERLSHAVLVFNGLIQGARIAGGALKELFVSPGSSVVFFSDTRKDMDVKVTESRKRVGFGRAKMPNAPEERILVGMTLGARGNPIGAAFSEKPLAMYEPTEEEKTQPREPAGRKQSPIAGRPYITLTLPGGSANTVAPDAPIRVSARNFPRGTSVEIVVDSVRVERVTVGERGEFRVVVRAPREFGLHNLTVRDAVTGKVIDGANFIVKAEDTRRERKF
jgi:photosystem II stability/assembly factor-like uncharacterized protein